MEQILLGCIADDFTGATDLANNLVRAGMRTLQTIGVPANPLREPVDAAVVALKTRTSPRDDAVAQSLAALRLAPGARRAADLFQVLLDLRQHCRRNIGPVTEALLDALGSGFTISNRPSPTTDVPYFAATSSSATSCCTRAECRIIR